MHRNSLPAGNSARSSKKNPVPAEIRKKAGPEPEFWLKLQKNIILETLQKISSYIESLLLFRLIKSMCLSVCLAVPLNRLYF